MQPIRSHRAGAVARTTGAGGPGGSDGEDAVYPAREDSHLLLPHAHVAPGTRVLEVGTGSGIVALAAARCGAWVVATDLNPHALRQLRARARAEALDLALVRTDLAAGLGRFDRVLSNPPYLPTRPAEHDPNRWHNLALDGGPDGTRVTARLVGELDRHLEAEGSAFIVVSSRQAPDALERIRRAWVARGGRVEVIDSRPLEGERLDIWCLRPGPL